MTRFRTDGESLPNQTVTALDNHVVYRGQSIPDFHALWAPQIPQLGNQSTEINPQGERTQQQYSLL